MEGGFGVLALVSALTKREVLGKLWVVQKGRIREYQPENVT